MPDPFFSVIMPVKDPDPAFFRQAFFSAHDQLKSSGGEILLQDNGDLWAVVDSLPGITASYEKNPRDIGCYGSVNAALKRARGEWVHVLHDDDWVLPGFYKKMFDACWDLPAPFAAASCIYGNAEGDRVGHPPWQFGHSKYGHPLGAWLARQLTSGNPLQVPAVVVRRSAFDAVGPFREDMPYAADWEMYARLLTKFDWWYEPADLARYRVHPGQRAHAMLRDGRAAKDVDEVRRLAAGYLRHREGVGV